MAPAARSFPPALGVPLVLAAALALGGCGLGGVTVGRSGRVPVAPHVVFAAQPGCPTAVATVFRGGYAVLTSYDEDYQPALGDILEGPTLEGDYVFRIIPEEVANRDWTEGRPLSVSVDGTGMSLSLARAQFEELCRVSPVEVPRLPGQAPGE